MIKYTLEKHSDNRGDLFVIEENKRLKFNFKYYYLIDNLSFLNNKELPQSIFLVVLKGNIIIEGENISVGESVYSNKINRVTDVSKVFKGVLLSFYKLSKDNYSIKLDVPFDSKRIFFINNIPYGAIRGQHAHKIQEQYLVCILGSLEVEIKRNKNIKKVKLDIYNNLYLPPNYWIELKEFSKDSLLLVFSSTIYLPNEYIQKTM